MSADPHCTLNLNDVRRSFCVRLGSLSLIVLRAVVQIMAYEKIRLCQKVSLIRPKKWLIRKTFASFPVRRASQATWAVARLTLLYGTVRLSRNSGFPGRATCIHQNDVPGLAYNLRTVSWNKCAALFNIGHRPETARCTGVANSSDEVCMNQISCTVIWLHVLILVNRQKFAVCWDVFILLVRFTRAFGSMSG